MFEYETKTGRGSGAFRIAKGDDGMRKGYIVYTVLKELKASKEVNGRGRPHGGNNSLLGGSIEADW